MHSLHMWGPLVFASRVSTNMICSCRKPSTALLTRVTPSLLSEVPCQLVMSWPATVVLPARACPFSAVSTHPGEPTARPRTHSEPRPWNRSGVRSGWNPWCAHFAAMRGGWRHSLRSLETNMWQLLPPPPLKWNHFKLVIWLKGWSVSCLLEDALWAEF